MQAQTPVSPNADWQGVSPLVERWLNERRQLISIYCTLTSRARKAARSGVLRDMLHRFRSQLVDYVCAGHFEVYSRLLHQAEQQPRPAADMLTRLFPQIALSTEIALAFDDDCGDGSLADPAALLERLSRLGEVMESRFAHEDRLIRLIRDHGVALAA